jgi:hypothetical protein
MRMANSGKEVLRKKGIDSFSYDGNTTRHQLSQVETMIADAATPSSQPPGRHRLRRAVELAPRRHPGGGVNTMWRATLTSYVGSPGRVRR